MPIVAMSSARKLLYKPSMSQVRQSPKDYVYQRKLHLITPTELSFFQILMSVVDRRYYYIIPQVHLSSLLKHAIRGQNWYGAFQHINRKSVDYVICTLKGLNPVCAIELDDDQPFA